MFLVMDTFRSLPPLNDDRELEIVCISLLGLRKDWRLGWSELGALLGLGPATCAVLDETSGLQGLGGEAEARGRRLLEVSRLARTLLSGDEFADWLQEPSAALRGSTPLHVMTAVDGGLCAIRGRLREEFADTFGEI